MSAPLTERECIRDILCFLFVNNFYFNQRYPQPSSRPSAARAGIHNHGACEIERAVVMGPGYPLRGLRDDACG
jgi:hypothetical protein